MDDFTIEDLDMALEHKNIVVSTPVLPGEYAFNRTRLVFINGNEYRIAWWRNQCYLEHDDMIVLFKYVRQSGTWPNNKKVNLQFYDHHNAVCCVVGIEGYDVHGVAA